MVRRIAVISGLVCLLILAGAAPALAGGWANVTLDRLPANPHAGQTFTLGFMVRQHGVTPINSVQPYLSARNQETGQTVRFSARQEGPVGHFIADVTFPAAGIWEWEVTPAPFPSSTKLGTLTVLPPLAAPSRPAGDAPSLAGIAITAPIALVNWRGVPGAPGRLRPLRSR